jgi:SOS-response transcriptional repressor LexA
VLTKNQRRALLLIEAEVERTGVARSVRELANQLGFRSATTGQRLLVGLEERGFIRRLPRKDRAIEVVRPVSRFATFKFDTNKRRFNISESGSDRAGLNFADLWELVVHRRARR